ncbi:hypothetical protein [Coleofasciculus sp. G2-EDA-02]
MGAGTGFMIAPDLLMTNNHVIANREQAEQTEYTFNYSQYGAGIGKLW